MLDDMSSALTSLRAEMLGAETVPWDGLADLPEQTQASARNLLHYLALRRHDLRGLQRQLEALGLSTLEGAESRTLENVEAVLGILRRLDLATSWRDAPNAGRALLDAHT
jgi:pyruvate kinase